MTRLCALYRARTLHPAPCTLHCIVLTCAVAVFPLLAAAATAQEDEFLRKRDADAKANIGGGFTIAFADDRRVFHPGETIPLTFTFRGLAVTHDVRESCSGLGGAEVVFENADPGRDPLADYWPNELYLSPLGCGGVICCRSGGISGAWWPGMPDPPEEPPVVLRLSLNHVVRLERPGRYRFYVRSWHHAYARRRDSPSLVSNVLSFDVTLRDPAWEAQLVDDAVRALDAPEASSAASVSAPRLTSADAVNAIKFLGSARAIDEMAQRLDASADRRPSIERGGRGDWLNGLFGAPDRPRVVARLEAELDKPGRYVSTWFAKALAVLELTRRNPGRPIDSDAHTVLTRAYSARHLRAQRAAGRLRPALAREFVAAATPAWNLEGTSLPWGFWAVPRDVEAAFDTLSPDQQSRLLTARRNWTAFHDPAFVPMLRRLVADRRRGGPQDIAFRLLYELDPVRARRIATDAITDPRSAIGAAGLDVLPDDLLPEYDDRLASALERARAPAEYLRIIGLVSRFASPSIADRVRRVYERVEGARGCELAPPALAYFFRVLPQYARAEAPKVERVMSADDLCQTALLPEVARIRMSPALEALAVDRLSDDDPGTIANALRVLERQGSAAAEAALWAGFERLRARWTSGDASIRDERGGLAYDLDKDFAEALTGGAGWRVDASFEPRLRALCLTERCGMAVRQAFDSPRSRPLVLLSPSDLPGNDPRIIVLGPTMVSVDTRAVFHKWALLQSAGTAFEWEERAWGDEDAWMPGELHRIVDQERAFLVSHGMALGKAAPRTLER